MNIELNNQQIDLILHCLKVHKAISKVTDNQPEQTEAKELIKYIKVGINTHNKPQSGTETLVNT